MRIKWHILQQEVEEKLTGSMTSFKKIIMEIKGRRPSLDLPGIAIVCDGDPDVKLRYCQHWVTLWCSHRRGRGVNDAKK
jgi:hypothetical protein